MGGWGPGNFDSDLAMDWYLNDFGKSMIGRLREIASDKMSFEPDEPESVEFICTLQVLTVLDEYLCPILPGRDVIAQWRDTYLEVFDASEPGRGDERRARIVETFDVATSRAEPEATGKSSAKATKATPAAKRKPAAKRTPTPKKSSPKMR